MAESETPQTKSMKMKCFIIFDAVTFLMLRNLMVYMVRMR